MTDLQRMAEDIFNSQPFSQFIGAKLMDVSDNQVTLGIELQPHHLQQHGFVHGGVISYLVDNTLTFAGGLSLQGNAVTSEFKVNYVKPAKGKLLVCEATTESVGSRQAVCTAKVYAIKDDNRLLCAIAQGTIVKFS